MTKLSLKAQNVAPLSLLILFQCVIAYFIAMGSVDFSFEQFANPTSGALLVVGVLSGWFSFLVPTNLKNSLVFLRLKMPYQGIGLFN